MSQTEAVLDWLERGNTLTPLEALHRFGILRLGARAHELKRRGLPIAVEMIQVGKKRVAQYRLQRGQLGLGL